MSKKLTIAAIYPAYGGGGVPAIGKLATLLDCDHFRVIHIFLKNKGVGKDSFDVDGQTFYCLSGKKKLHTLSLPMLFRLAHILKDEKVDIIHAHRHKPCFYGSLAGLIAKTAVVLFHVHGLNRTKNFGRRILNSFMFRHVNKIIGCANSVKEDIVKANPSVDTSKVIAMRNSVEYKRFSEPETTKSQIRQQLGISMDAFVFGTVGRFAPTKGYTYLVDAFAKVKGQIPTAELLFVGTGYQMDEIKSQAESLGLSKCVHFLGIRNDVPQVLAAMDIFVLPSIAEGMPYAVMEAMAAGVAIVASAVGGIPELLDDGKYGKLVPSKDAAALADAMIEFANMPPSDREQIIEKASERIRRSFDHDVVAKELARLYECEIQNGKNQQDRE